MGVGGGASREKRTTASCMGTYTDSCRLAVVLVAEHSSRGKTAVRALRVSVLLVVRRLLVQSGESRGPMPAPVSVLALLTALTVTAFGIKCYCTDDHCVPYGVCESQLCLVGIVRNTNSVIRTCGSELVGCRKDVGRWSDLCACDQPFCNTFAYLRSHTRHEQTPSNTDDALVFRRVDGPHAANDRHMDDGDLRDSDVQPTPKNSLLVFTLVPLSVAAALVLVITFNYYCHLG
uniref:Activin_recp domain-containing protein n=1 Tax=Steinernema glaseri TaxID=37863 RepID=A0A1I8AD10_9BILA